MTLGPSRRIEEEVVPNWSFVAVGFQRSFFWTVMKLIYIDESGTADAKADPDQPFYLMSALLVDEAKVHEAAHAVRAVARSHVGLFAEIGDFELRGPHIRSGKGPFKGMKPGERVNLMRALASLPAELHLRFGYVAIDKRSNWAARHPNDLAPLLLIEKLQEVLKEDNQMGLIVAPTNQVTQQGELHDRNPYSRLAQGLWGGPTKAENLVESVYFVQQKRDWTMQLAGVLSYIVSRGRHAEQRMFAEFRSSGLPLTGFANWRQSNMRPPQALDLALFDSLGKPRFAKSFPK